ncbi:MAG: radical SAM protein [Candidatus Altiarchaeota archaeon]
MDVCLVVPPGNTIRDVSYGCWHERKVQYLWPPLNLAYYAAVLMPRNHVKILDCQASSLSFKEAVERVVLLDPDYLVIESATTSFLDDVDFLKKIRERIDVKTIVCGVQPTVLPKETISEKTVDYAIRGDAEAVLDQVVSQDASEAPGVCTRGHIMEKVHVEDLDSLPFPARELFAGKYANPFAVHNPFTTFIATRGCSFSCDFCTSPAFYGGRFRKRSVENVIKELNSLRGTYREIFFRDENITFDRGYVQEICKGMIAQKMDYSWMCNSRVDTLDEKTLALMKKSGCHLIKFGVESSSQKTLKMLGKKTTIRGIEKTFGLCNKLGIESLAHFMIGNPGENAKDVQNTIDFAIKLDPDYASFDVFIPLPGTKIYDKLEKEGEISLRHVLEYGKFKTKLNEKFTEINAGELELLYNTAFRRFYVRPSIIVKSIKHVKSKKRLVDFTKATVDLWRRLFFQKS